MFVFTIFKCFKDSYEREEMKLEVFLYFGNEDQQAKGTCEKRFLLPIYLGTIIPLFQWNTDIEL